MAAPTLRKRAWRVVLATLVAGLGIPILTTITAPSSTAQTVCVYPLDNCVTVPTLGGIQLQIVIDLDRGRPGDTLRVRVCNAPAGTLVEITFNGIVVSDAIAALGSPACAGSFARAPSNGSGGGVLAAAGPLGAALRGRIHPQSGGAGAVTSFRVPSNVPDGRYLVCAQAAGFGSACAPFTVDSTSVAGAVFGSNGGAPLVSATNPNSFLAFTGLGLLRLVLLAATLIALGWYLARRHRQPRRAVRSA